MYATSTMRVHRQASVFLAATLLWCLFSISARAAQAPVRINCGNTSETVTSPDGRIWSPDAHYSDGGLYYRSGYEIETRRWLGKARYGLYTPFSYNVPLENGSYTLNLYFVELESPKRGWRIFDVVVNGQVRLNDFEILAEADFYEPLVKSIPVTVTNGKMNIGFEMVERFGMISAIEILPAGSGPPAATPTLSVAPPSVTLNPGESVTITPTVTNASAANVVWSVTPSSLGSIASNGRFTASASLSAQTAGKITASLQSNPGVSAQTAVLVVPISDPVDPTPPGPVQTSKVVRINAGNTKELFVDENGNTWQMDEYYDSGDLAQNMGLPVDVRRLLGMSRRGLYTDFSYRIPVPSGRYKVALNFVETILSSPGRRVFNVKINGNQALTNFDILKEVPFSKTAQKVFTADSAGGYIEIDFIGITNRGIVSSIEIVPESSEVSRAWNAPGEAPPTASEPQISLSGGNVSLNANEGDSSSTSQQIQVANSGGGTLSFTATANKSWVKLSPANGVAPRSLTVSASPGSLAPGTHSAVVTVSASGVASKTFGVQLSVTPSTNPPPSSGVPAEGLTLTDLSGQWRTVSLSRNYQSPVVVCTPHYLFGSAPLAVRLKNVGSSSFQARIERMDDTGAAAPSTLTRCLAVEEGVYTQQQHGVNLEAVKMTSTATDGGPVWEGQQRSYSNNYSAPVVLGQVLTSNDPTASVFWANGGNRTSPPSSSNLHVGKHVGENANRNLANETVGYIVAEKGSWSFGGLAIEAGLQTGVQGSDDNPPYMIPLSAGSEGAVLSAATMVGVDGGWPVLWALNAIQPTALKVVFGEDQFRDAERNHIAETVAFLAWSDGSTSPTPTPTLTLSTTSLQLAADQGSAGSQSVTVNVGTDTGDNVAWTAQALSNWLHVSPASGTTPGAVGISANTSGLGAGNYSGQVRITANGASGSPKLINVSLQITATPPVVIPPVVSGGTQFYVAPNGRSGANGSINDPWDMGTALAHPSAVKPGDTIWVRGGVYQGPFRSYLKGTQAKPIIFRAYPGERATLDSGNRMDTSAVLDVREGDTWYWGLEIMSSNPNRITSQSGSRGSDNLRIVDGVNTFGVRNKFINLIVHDTRQGYGLWEYGIDNEVYGNLIYYNGWSGSDRGHGHGVYSQNRTGIKHIEDNIQFKGYAMGIRAYGSSAAAAKGYRFDGNISFESGYLHGGADNKWANFMVAVGSGAEDIIVDNTYTYMDPSTNDGYSWLGWEGSGRQKDIIARNNWWIGGETTVDVALWDDITYTGNVHHTRDGYMMVLRMLGSQSTSRYIWNNNTYYGRDKFWYKGQNLNFNSWKSTTGLDKNSTFTTSAPTGLKTFVRPNKYEEGRAHIVVYNFDKLMTAPVNVSQVLKVGDRYEVRDAENFYGPPVLSGVYDGRPLPLPMFLTAIAQPSGKARRDPVHTGPDFNAFVLLKK